MESGRLETRLGPLAWQSSGQGPAIVFFAGALANHDLWRDVITTLEDRYRCVTVDLPLGAHPWPLRREQTALPTSLARLILDSLELLDLRDATVVANDTAGGLLLLSLACDHAALGRIGRLVLTNCESYDHFPPNSLRIAPAMCRRLPGSPGARRPFAPGCGRLRRKAVAAVSETDSTERADRCSGRPFVTAG